MFLFAILSVSLSVVVWLWLIRKHDRLEPESLKKIMTVLLLGGISSATISGVLNNFVFSVLGVSFESMIEHSGDWLSMLFAMLFVGLNEEFWKLLVTVLLIRNSKEFDEPVDAIIFSMSVAIGFGAIENIQYIMALGPDVVVVRSVLSIGVHLSCAAVWGYGIARARFVEQGRYLPVLFPYWLAAAAFHAAFNYMLVLSAYTVILAYPVIFYLARNSNQTLKRLEATSPFAILGTCLKCGKTGKVSNKFCDSCGERLVELDMAFICTCGECGKHIFKNELFCKYCGAELTKSQLA